MLKRIVILLFLGILLLGIARAQTGTWATYLSPTKVNDYAEQDNKAYFATDAGIFVMDKTTRAIEHWTKSANGLPSDQVESIAFHPVTKTMFIGTYDIALAYYDQGEWHNLTYPESLIPDFGNPALTYCIAFDAEGRLWAGTDKGLVRYTEGQWALYNQQNTGLFINTVWKLEHDQQGRILVGSHVLARVEGEQIEQLSPETGANPSQFIFAYSNANMICQHNGDLWFFTDIGTYCHYDNALQNWEVGNFIEETGLPWGEIEHVAEDQEGVLWAQFGQNGFIRFDGSAWEAASPLGNADAEAVSSGLVFADWATLLFYENKILVHTPELPVEYALGNYPYAAPVSQLLIDHQGEVWGNEGYNALRNLVSGELIAFTANGQPLYLSSPAFDAQGRLWAMGSGRVACYHNGEWQVFDSSNSPLPVDEYYAEMYVDGQGDVWVYIYEWGICHFNGQNWKAFQHPVIANGYVTSMGARQPGEIWLSIWTNNLGTRMYRFDGDILTIENLGFTLNYAAVISTDPLSGRVYVAGTPSHIEYWDNGAWSDLALPQALPTSGYINSLIADNGRLIAATQTHLLLFENNEWTVFNSQNSPLSSANISDIVLDQQAQLWIVHGNLPRLEIYQAGLVNSLPDPATGRNALLMLAPNPAVNSVTLHYDTKNESPAFCKIYNLQGQVVRQLTVTAGNHPTIDLNGLDSGIYLVSLSAEGRQIATARLVVQGEN